MSSKKAFLYFVFIFVLISLICIVVILYLNKNVYSRQPDSSNILVNKKNQADPMLPFISKSDIIVSHSYYTLCYSNEYEQASWVAYKISLEREYGIAKRKDDFRADPEVPGGSANPADYKKSGYDKGHLCPAADMSFSVKAMSESFFMSNMSPQKPQFNRGIWKELEEKVRMWGLKNKLIYVTTGPVILKNCKYIGVKNKIAVPAYYFKVILDYSPPEYKGIGFIMKNEGSSRNLFDFAVSIDSVEKFTGLDFFVALPDALEKDIEKNLNTGDW